MLVLLLSASIGSAVTHAQREQALDVAALTLRPADISQPGWGHLGAFVQSLEAEAEDVASYRGVASNEVGERLRSIGWIRSYVTVLGLTGADGSSAPRPLIRSYVTEYSDATGAAAGFAYLEDEASVPTATDVALDLTLGDESEATRDRGSSNSRPFRSLDITFRTGALVAGVTVVNTGTGALVDPDLAEAERLAAILAARIASPPVPRTTLGGAVLRLDGTGYQITTYDDAYYRFDGQDVTLVDETAASRTARTTTYADASDVYQLWQGLDAGTTAGVLYGVTLLRFPNAKSAAIWVSNLEQILDENAFYGNLQSIAPPMLGEQAVALTYAPGGGGSDAPQASLVAVRIGVDVARIHLVPQGDLKVLPVEVVNDLARAQGDCLQVLNCPEAVSDLTALAAVLAATPVPGPVIVPSTPEAKADA